MPCWPLLIKITTSHVREAQIYSSMFKKKTKKNSQQSTCRTLLAAFSAHLLLGQLTCSLYVLHAKPPLLLTCSAVRAVTQEEPPYTGLRSISSLLPARRVCGSLLLLLLLVSVCATSPHPTRATATATTIMEAQAPPPAGGTAIDIPPPDAAQAQAGAAMDDVDLDDGFEPLPPASDDAPPTASGLVCHIYHICTTWQY